jgi:hypothetical protein
LEAPDGNAGGLPLIKALSVGNLVGYAALKDCFIDSHVHGCVKGFDFEYAPSVHGVNLVPFDFCKEPIKAIQKIAEKYRSH